MSVWRGLKWILGLGVVGGGVALFAGSAGASTPTGPDPSKGGEGVRAGIRYEGCSHFELVDIEAAKAWGLANALALQARIGLKSVADLREDPEVAVQAFFGLAFPECDGPEDATFGPERRTYVETLAQIQEALAGYEGTAETEAEAVQVAELVLLAMTAGLQAPGPVVEPPGPGPKLPPIPTPDPPPMDGEGAPSTGDVLLLEDADDFAAADLLEVLDPGAGTTVDVPRTIVAGYSEGWTGQVAMLARLEDLAAANPDVEVVAFSFVKSREVLGKPDAEAPIAYVVTAVDPDGVPMGEQYASANMGAPPLPEVRWASLLEYARQGYDTPPGSVVVHKVKDGQGYTVLISPPKTDKSGAWSWWVWKGPRLTTDKAIATGASLGEAKAREHALAAIAST